MNKIMPKASNTIFPLDHLCDTAAELVFDQFGRRTEMSMSHCHSVFSVCNYNRDV